LTILIQHDLVVFRWFGWNHADRQVHSGCFIMGASLRPKGAAFPKGKAVRVREEARASLGAKVLSDSLELGPGERWFVARVLTHQENRAQFNLHRLGFRSFLPRLRRTVRHARKLRDTLNPLFPGYIFVIIDLSKHRWRSINGTFGVASLIMGGEQPMPVPPHVVEALVASCESHGVVRLDDGLEIGQKVRILSGPFAETLCRLARLDDRGRVHVLLEIMGMEVAAQLDRSAIAPAA
jgi:transcription antitermination factor NusG